MSIKKRKGIPLLAPPPTPPQPQNVKRVGDALELEYLFPEPKPEIKKFFKSYWSSPEVFAAHIETLDKKQAWHKSGWDEERSSKWNGTKNMAEAIEIARTGWKAGLEKATRLLGKIMASHPLQKKPKKYGIAGTHPNVPRAIAGDPMNMHLPDPRKASRRPVITLLSDIGANWTHSGEELVNRAAVVAALVDHIEAAGYACDVIAFSGSLGGGMFDDGDSHFASVIAIQLKNSAQPVDIQRLAFGLGHSSMFRRLVFAEKGGDDFCRSLGHGLGYHLDFDPEGQKELATDGVYMIPSVEGTSCFKTEEDAETQGLHFLIKSLKDQGMPAFADTVVEEVQAEVIKKKAA